MMKAWNLALNLSEGFFLENNNRHSKIQARGQVSIWPHTSFLSFYVFYFFVYTVFGLM